jgi:hypothetical protein
MPGERRVVLSLVLVSVLLAGQALPVVDAVYATLFETTYSQDLQADNNGHTYLYVPEPDSFYPSRSSLVHDSSMDINEYQYTSSSWSLATDSLLGIGEQMEDVFAGGIAWPGWLANVTICPKFYEFINTTNSYELGLRHRFTYFGMPIGEEVSVVLDPSFYYYGTFNVTTQEFFHLTLAARQDFTDITVFVMDEFGRGVNEYMLTDGDIDVIPFAPDGPGMYIVILFTSLDAPGLPIVDLRLDAITPDPLLADEIVEGVLPGSELVVKDEGGDTIHQEKAPSAHTFKLSPNTASPGRLQWSLNQPELDDEIYDPYEPRLEVTSDMIYTGFLHRYLTELSLDGGEYYYQTSNDESYYFTIIGMEETTYTLLNDFPDLQTLPLGTPIFLESFMTDRGVFAYRLPLATDSLLKLNTSTTSGFNWAAFRIFEDYTYRAIQIPESTTFHNAQPVYLPAGEYVIYGTAESIGNSAVTTFTLGPVVEDVSHVSVYNNDIVGIRVPTEALSFYRFNVTLETHDNVTVDCDIDFFNQYGTILYATGPTLGNQQAGLGWVAVGSNRSLITHGFAPYYSMFCDGYSIVSISPYRVQNNTGVLTELPDPYMVDYSLTQENYAPMIFNGTESWSQASPGWTNFTLGDPGEPTEVYMIEADCTPGTWFNVTYLTEDVDGIFDIIIYQRYDGCTYRLDLTDLTDTLTGTVARSEFEFGSISNELVMLFIVDRDLSFEGSLDVYITPYDMNTYTYPPTPRYIGSAGAGGGTVDLGAVAIVAGVAGLAVVVVVIIFVARKRGMF